MNLLNNTVICGVPGNFYRGFEYNFVFREGGGPRSFFFGCFYYFHLIVNFQNHRDADITF